MRMSKVSRGALIKGILGEVSPGPSSPSRPMTTRMSHSFSFCAGRLLGDSSNYVEFVCSSPFLKQFLTTLIGRKKGIATQREGTSRAILKSVGVLPSSLMGPEFHALSHSINIKEITSTDLPKRTSHSNL